MQTQRQQQITNTPCVVMQRSLNMFALFLHHEKVPNLSCICFHLLKWSVYRLLLNNLQPSTFSYLVPYFWCFNYSLVKHIELFQNNVSLVFNVNCPNLIPTTKQQCNRHFHSYALTFRIHRSNQTDPRFNCLKVSHLSSNIYQTIILHHRLHD